MEEAQVKRHYVRPAFNGVRNLDSEPERKLLLTTIFLFGEYLKPIQVIPMVLAAKCGNPSTTGADMGQKAAGAKA